MFCLNWYHFTPMLDTIKKYWPAKILVLLFGFFSLWWVYMTLFLDKAQSDDPFSLFGIYGIFYGIIAAWSAITGFSVSKHWGGWKSVMGRAIIMFSLGLIFQEFGQIAYSYYIFILNHPVYPSVGDIGFFGTIPFYIYGAYLLGLASGIRFSMQSVRSKIQAVIIPVTMLIVAYVLILRNYSFDLENPLVTFLDYGYPTGQAIYISIALLTYNLTKNYLGGIMKDKIRFLIIAFFAQFFADYCFVIFKNSYYPGSILDYLYVIAYTLMGLGICQLATTLKSIKAK